MLIHCAPIFFLPTESISPATICANGTVGLIDTGQKKLLVTCAHVWTGFEDLRLTHPSSQLAVIFASGYAKPERINKTNLIDFDAGLDLAVFEACPEWNMGHKEFYRITRWPVPQAKVGQPIAFLGFAGTGRKTSAHWGQFSYSVFGLSVNCTSDRKLVTNSPSKGTLFFDDGKPIGPIDIRGMSGSPAYVRDRKGGFNLAAFVQMGHMSDDSIFLTHASFLNPDGTLTK